MKKTALNRNAWAIIRHQHQDGAGAILAEHGAEDDAEAEHFLRVHLQPAVAPAGVRLPPLSRATRFSTSRDGFFGFVEAAMRHQPARAFRHEAAQQQHAEAQHAAHAEAEAPA